MLAVHGGFVNVMLTQILIKVVPYLTHGDPAALSALRDTLLDYSEAHPDD